MPALLVTTLASAVAFQQQACTAVGRSRVRASLVDVSEERERCRAESFAAMPPLITSSREGLFAREFEAVVNGARLDKDAYLELMRAIAFAVPDLELNADNFHLRGDGVVAYEVRMVGTHTAPITVDGITWPAHGARIIGDLERALVAFDEYGRVVYIEAGEVLRRLDDEAAIVAARGAIDAAVDSLDATIAEHKQRMLKLMGASGGRTVDDHAENRELEESVRVLEMERARHLVRTHTPTHPIGPAARGCREPDGSLHPP